MLNEIFQMLTRQQLNTRAKASLEYGMLVMVVVVSALGALSPGAPAPAQPLQAANTNIQLASLK